MRKLAEGAGEEDAAAQGWLVGEAEGEGVIDVEKVEGPERLAEGLEGEPEAPVDGAAVLDGAENQGAANAAAGGQLQAAAVALVAAPAANAAAKAVAKAASKRVSTGSGGAFAVLMGASRAAAGGPPLKKVRVDNGKPAGK